MSASGPEPTGTGRLRGWLVAAVVALVLGGAAVAVYFSTRPPSPRVEDKPPSLEERLRSSDFNDRLAAIAEAGERGAEAAPLAPALCECLKGANDPKLKDAAAAALVKIGPKAAPALRAALAGCEKYDDKDRIGSVLVDVVRSDYRRSLREALDGNTAADERKALRAALLAIYPTPAAAVTGLLQALRVTEGDGRPFVITALSRADQSAYPAIVQALRDRNANVRGGVLLAMGDWQRPDKLPEGTAALLLGLLKDADAGTRIGAARALGAVQLETDEAASALFKQVMEDEPVRGAAASALGRLGDQGLSRLLEAAKDERPAVRHAVLDGFAARWELAKRQESPPSDDAAAAIVLKALEGPDHKLRQQALEGLLTGRLPGNEAAFASAAALLTKAFEAARGAQRVLLLTNFARLALHETADGKKRLGRATACALFATNRDPKLREEAADTIIVAGPMAVAAAVELLADEDAAVRADAALALDGLLRKWYATLIYNNADREKVLTRVLMGLGHPNRKVRLHFLQYLAASRRANDYDACEVVATALMPLLAGRDAEVRLAAIKALPRYGHSQHIAALVRLLTNTDEGTRRAAAEALGVLRGPPPRELDRANLPALTRALRHRDVAVRRCAAEAIGWVKGTAPETLEELIEALADPDLAVREAATKTLGGSGAEAAPPLVKALRAEKAEVRSGAVAALARIGAEAVPALVLALQDKEKLARLGAARALGGIGRKAKQAAPALREALRDDGPEVRQAAEAALKAITPPGDGM